MLFVLRATATLLLLILCTYIGEIAFFNKYNIAAAEIYFECVFMGR